MKLLFALLLALTLIFAYTGAYYDSKQYVIKDRVTTRTYYHNGSHDNAIIKSHPTHVRDYANRPYARINYMIAGLLACLTIIVSFTLGDGLLTKNDCTTTNTTGPRP